MFPTKNVEEDETQITERFSQRRRSSNGFYESNNAVTRHSVPVQSKAKMKPIGDDGDDAGTDSGDSDDEGNSKNQNVSEDDDFFNNRRRPIGKSVQEKRTNLNVS